MSDHLPTPPTGSARRPAGDSVLRTAPIAPLHDDGVRVFAIGTLALALAAGLLWLNPLAWQLPDWWLTVALAGAAIGVIASGYCIWRRDKRAKDAALGIAPPTA